MMKTYARIEDGVVVELFETDGDISEMFHPDLVWVVVPDGAEVACGWTYAAGKFSAPVVLAPTAEELKASARVWRDGELTASQWLVERHRDQVAAGSATNLTGDQYAALLNYRQALRDWPAASGFPADTSKPSAPEWLTAAEAA